jgi:hypothetical protein
MLSAALLALGGLTTIILGQFAPVPLQRAIVVYALYIGRSAYPILVVASALVLGASVIAALSLRMRGRPWRSAMRGALPAGAVLAMVLPIELVAARVLRWSHRLPELPTQFDAPEADESGSAHSRNIVVIGESSARGEPYDFSVAQIAAWQLERVFPGTRFDVTMLARGGLSLEDALLYLVDLKQRPDAVIIYSGHNECQARYRWSRTFAYSADDGASTSATLLPKELTRHPPCRRCRQALERHSLERRRRGRHASWSIVRSTR